MIEESRITKNLYFPKLLNIPFRDKTLRLSHSEPVEECFLFQERL